MQVQSLNMEDPLEKDDNPLQYFCLKNSMDRGDWWGHVSTGESGTTEQLNNNKRESPVIGTHTIKSPICQLQISGLLSLHDRASHFLIINLLAFLIAQMVKNPPAMLEPRVQSLGQEDPLEKGMGTHSSILAREIPWTE